VDATSDGKTAFGELRGPIPGLDSLGGSATRFYRWRLNSRLLEELRGEIWTYSFGKIRSVHFNKICLLNL
jgi:hypothetical protein